MYIPQEQLRNLKRYTRPGKAVIVFGPRRCGKTTLLKHFVEDIEEEYLFVSGEDINVHNYLCSQSIEKLKSFVGGRQILIIDEAQKIGNIGVNIKLIVDHIPGIKVIATGSSSFDLARQIGEPLTGRKYTLKMFPLSQIELGRMENRAETDSLLEERLIWGSYPEVVLCRDNSSKETYLKELVSSYLYKDILELDGLRHSDKLIKLLQLLSFQIGKEVSYNELGRQLGMSRNTVDRYLDLLTKAFVLIKMTGFSRNLRKEVSKNPRYYFYDIGVRNALINNFNPISIRDDLGMLWENYVIVERLKKQEYLDHKANNYYWRTYDMKEIDLVEEKGGKLYGYEIKWKKKKTKPPKEWKNSYTNSEYKVICRDNYLGFIT